MTMALQKREREWFRVKPKTDIAAKLSTSICEQTETPYSTEIYFCDFMAHNFLK